MHVFVSAAVPRTGLHVLKNSHFSVTSSVTSHVRSVSLPVICSFCTRMITQNSTRNAAADVNAFLANSRSQLSQKTITHVFLGNESCDLDSIASTLALAYRACADGVQALPMLNIPREDLYLRRDATHLLEETGIRAELLTFVNELDFHTFEQLSITLVDHNELATHQTCLEKYVTAVIDHHKDSGRFQTASPRIVEGVGSCATLATSRIENRAIAYLLLSAIMADTAGLKKRVTDKDVSAVRTLSETCEIEEKALANLHKKLSAWKRQCDDLTAKELLRMDYKTFGNGIRAGIASVNISLTDWANREGDHKLSRSILADVAKTRNVQALLIMSAFKREGVFYRELLISGEAEAAR